jgi:Cys-tRNA(Pro)/Cys-tRNA(Cys) deacylase
VVRRETTGTPATKALARAGVQFSTHVYEHDPRSTSFGLEAAQALDLSPDEVFKTLMALVDDRPVIAVVPVSGSLDLKALAAAAGGRRAEMADPAHAARLTGYVVGGISPIAQKRALPTFVDETAELFDVVYVSGGRRGLDIGLAPDELLRMTDGRLAPISRSPGVGR